MIMENRINCLIAGCKRTRKNDKFDEWICEKHWRVVPKRYRRLYSMAKRKFRKMQISQERIESIWIKCKDQAFINAWNVY